MAGALNDRNSGIKDDMRQVFPFIVDLSMDLHYNGENLKINGRYGPGRNSRVKENKMQKVTEKILRLSGVHSMGVIGNPGCEGFGSGGGKGSCQASEGGSLRCLGRKCMEMRYSGF